MPGFTADSRIYLNRDRSQIVDESDPEASFLLAAPGQAVSSEDAEKFGLKAPRKATDGEPESKAIHSSQVEDKAIHGPSRVTGTTGVTGTDPNVTTEASHTSFDRVSGVQHSTGQTAGKSGRKG